MKKTITTIRRENISSLFQDTFVSLLPFKDHFAPKGWIAGGAIRSRLTTSEQDKSKDSDFDCYFYTEEDLLSSQKLIESSKYLEPELKVNDAHLISYSTVLGEVDLVKKYYPGPIQCLKDFDFTICCFALDSNYFYYLEQAVSDLENKKIILFSPTCPFSSMMRGAKYAAKGYKMPFEESEKLARMIQDRKHQETINSTINKIKDRQELFSEVSAAKSY